MNRLTRALALGDNMTTTSVNSVNNQREDALLSIFANEKRTDKPMVNFTLFLTSFLAGLITALIVGTVIPGIH